MDDIQTNLERREKELKEAFDLADDEIKKLEILRDLLNIGERLARLECLRVLLGVTFQKIGFVSDQLASLAGHFLSRGFAPCCG